MLLCHFLSTLNFNKGLEICFHYLRFDIVTSCFDLDEHNRFIVTRYYFTFCTHCTKKYKLCKQGRMHVQHYNFVFSYKYKFKLVLSGNI